MHGQVCSGHCQSADDAWLPLTAFGFLQDQMVIFFLFARLGKQRGSSQADFVRLSRLWMSLWMGLNSFPFPTARRMSSAALWRGWLLQDAGEPFFHVFPSAPSMSAMAHDPSLTLCGLAGFCTHTESSPTVLSLLPGRGVTCIQTQLRFASRNPSCLQGNLPHPPLTSCVM